MNHEIPDVQTGFRKGKGTRDQIANIGWIIEKAREFQKNVYFCFINYAKAFDCLYHNKLWKILKDMGIPDHLTWLLRNLYEGQETTVKTRPGKTDFPNWGRSPSRLYIATLLNKIICRVYHAKYQADEAQAGVKIVGRNTKNLRYADDITPMVESEEELKNPWWKWKRRVKKLA